jgi:3-dehydroquinate dehydratase-1
VPARPRICATIIENDLEAIKGVGPVVDLFEVRIDLIGKEWHDLAKNLGKPWIACNRPKEEGGKWRGDESGRIGELLRAVELGASILDLELATPGLKSILNKVRGKAECLVSQHNFKGTPSLDEMKTMVKKQLEVGADICKVVTTARIIKDNFITLRLIKSFPGVKMVSFAMGEKGIVSRILCPLAGGYFTYTSMDEGKESASGQLTADQLSKIYGMIGND